MPLHRRGRRAQQPNAPEAAQGEGDSRQQPQGSNLEEEQQQNGECEAPLSAAAAMLNIFRSIPTQMVGQPSPEAWPRPGPRPLAAAGGVVPLPPCGVGTWV